ncbi:MAG: transposase [Firmicutes bacterium]|nr:transposase [Candidatus Fermentithermobacillaceae bacterium]
MIEMGNGGIMSATVPGWERRRGDMRPSVRSTLVTGVICMGRQARQESAFDYYHVIVRGNNRETVFLGPDERSFFMGLLENKVNEGAIDLAAYCVMSNHAHMVVHCDLVSLANAMSSINIQYAMRFNRDMGRIGHVFQDRYKSKAIFSEHHLLRVIRYVHRNPVNANLVRFPDEYAWSSYNEYLEFPHIIGEHQKQFVLGFFHGISEFVKFHRETDNDEYMDVPEEIERDRTRRAQSVILDYLREKEIGAAAIGDCQAERLASLDRNSARELIGRLLEVPGLTHRRIAGLMGISTNQVHRVSLGRMKAANENEGEAESAVPPASPFASGEE